MEEELLRGSVMANDRREVVRRLREVELAGGSHQMLAAIGAAVLPTHHGWTSGACRALRDRLVELVEDGEGASLSERNLAYSLGYEEGRETMKADMKDMIERSFMAVPLDADGQPIHVGDVMDTAHGVEEVEGILPKRFLVLRDGDWLTVHAGTCRHHQPDSWERIVRDAIGASEDAVLGDGSYAQAVESLVARCRALAGES